MFFRENVTLTIHVANVIIHLSIWNLPHMQDAFMNAASVQQQQHADIGDNHITTLWFKFFHHIWLEWDWFSNTLISVIFSQNSM
jgi:hypothetical protein